MRLSRSIANEEELFSNGEAPYVKLLEGGEEPLLLLISKKKKRGQAGTIPSKK